jgi:diguanylate cyclase (GGDEF)-like protein
MLPLLSKSIKQLQPISKPLQPQDRLWHLTMALQKTLDLPELLQTLFAELHQELNISALDYHHLNEKIDIDLGKRKPHHCEYRLSDEGRYLGDLRLSRAEKFSKSDLLNIESALSLLIYPLNNALLYRQALQSALIDSLTGAGNRIAMNTDLHREKEVAKRYDQPLSIAMLDIDHFKQINDQYGHAAGDLVLQEIVQRLAKNSRCADKIYRYGGEEFMVLFTKTPLLGANIITERLRRLIDEKPFHHKEQRIHVTASFGLITLNSNDDLHSLLERADAALYQAKHQGRNCVVKLSYEEHVAKNCKIASQ